MFSLKPARGRAVGEASPAYSTIPQEGIDYLKHLLGPVKIIYLIRHPVRRALSQLRMNAQRSGEPNPDWQHHAQRWAVFNRGDYATYVPRWEAAFGDDLLVIPFGDISSDPAGVMTRVERHIGVKPFDGYKGLEKKAHVSRPADIPADVVAYLEREMEPQCAFLRDHFGQGFFERT